MSTRLGIERRLTKAIHPWTNWIRGCQVILAHSGPDAICIIEKTVPSFVVLDINLPGANGFQVLRAIRRNRLTAETPAFMLTGRTTVESQLASF